MNIGQLEQKLFETFPAADAEGWDSPGLVAGDRSEEVAAVAFNLDMTLDAVFKAYQAGCNVLVTHHPAYIGDGPEEFGPASQVETPSVGRVIYEAARKGLSLIAMHTNADRSPLVRKAYDKLFGLKAQCSFESLQNESLDANSKGFGMVYSLNEAQTLKSFAKIVANNFDTAPCVWGSPSFEVKKFAMLNGSWGEPSLYNTAVTNKIDCLIVGETKYHIALNMQPNVCVIELGHDISELPIVPVLAEAVKDVGISEDKIINLELSKHYWQNYC